MLKMPSRLSKSLRTKKGCVVCRARRKKCDERRPACATCERLGLKCHFPDGDSLEDRRERGAKNSRWSKPIDSQSRVSRSYKSAEDENVVYYAFMPSPQREVSTDSIVFIMKTSFYGILSSAEIFLRSDREMQLSTYYFESFLPDNLLPEAYASCITMHVDDVSETRDAMLACASIHLSNRCHTAPVEAINYVGNREANSCLC